MAEPARHAGREMADREDTINGLGFLNGFKAEVGYRFEMVIAHEHWATLARNAVDPEHNCTAVLQVVAGARVILAEVVALMQHDRIELKIMEVRRYVPRT